MKLIYPLLVVFFASAANAQKTQKSTIADTLITATDTLVFKKDTVKLSKVEQLIRQANVKQFRPQEAIVVYKKALAAKTKEQDSTWVGDVRFAMAKMYFKANNSTDGFLNLLAAQALYSQAINLSCQSAVTREIAEIYEGNNDWTEAERYYQLAIKQQESVGLFLDMPYTSLAFANGYYKRKDYANAEKYYAAALNQFELNAEKNKRAEALVKLADIKVKQKNYAQAEHIILKRAMPFFSSVGKPEAKIACFNMLGDIYYIQNRLSEAKWFYIQAYTSYQNAADFDGMIRSTVNLAKVKSAIGDNKSALKDFKDAEAQAIKRKNLALAADVKVAYARYYNKPRAKQSDSQLLASVGAAENTKAKPSALKDTTVARLVKAKPKTSIKSTTPVVKAAKAPEKLSVAKVAVKKDSTTATLPKTEKKMLKPLAKAKEQEVGTTSADLKANALPPNDQVLKEKPVAKVEKVAVKEEIVNTVKN